MLGGVAYALLRLALSSFYGALGVTPEEVGWDAAAVLTRFTLPVISLLFCAFYLFVILVYGVLERGGSAEALFVKHWRWLVPAAVIVMVVMLVVFARKRVNDLRRGSPLGVTLDSAMPISAPCVHALWIDVPDAQRANLPAFDTAHKYFFLGAAGMTTVLYDASTDAALRVPTSRIVLRNCGS